MDWFWTSLIIISATILFVTRKKCFTCGATAYSIFNCMTCSAAYCFKCGPNDTKDFYGGGPLIPRITGPTGPIGRQCQYCRKPQLEQIRAHLNLIQMQRKWREKYYAPLNHGYSTAKNSFEHKSAY